MKNCIKPPNMKFSQYLTKMSIFSPMSAKYKGIMQSCCFCKSKINNQQQFLESQQILYYKRIYYLFVFSCNRSSIRDNVCWLVSNEFQQQFKFLTQKKMHRKRSRDKLEESCAKLRLSQAIKLDWGSSLSLGNNYLAKEIISCLKNYFLMAGVSCDKKLFSGNGVNSLQPNNSQ